MKYIALIISLLILSHISKAQQDVTEYKTIHQDTVNITGIVYLSDGKPAPRVEITSKNNEYKYYGYPLTSITDNDGKFQLNGARFNDTITVTTFQHTLKIANNGARYLAITLPPDRVPLNFKADTITVRAKKQHQKKSTSDFKVEVATILDYGCAINGQQNQFGGGMSISILSKKEYPTQIRQLKITLREVLKLDLLCKKMGNLQISKY